MELMDNRRPAVRAGVSPKTGHSLCGPALGPDVNRAIRSAMRSGTSPGISRTVNKREASLVGVGSKLVVGSNPVENLPPLGPQCGIGFVGAQSWRSRKKQTRGCQREDQESHGSSLMSRLV